MSKNINVNPDHYKTAGRERPGQDIPQEVRKQQFGKEKVQPPPRRRRRRPTQPGSGG
jgi:hypothetical protein